MKTPAYLLVTLTVVFLISSCAPPHQHDLERIEPLRDEAEGFVKAQALMQFRSWAYGDPINQDSLYHAHDALFTRENIALINKAGVEEPDSIQKKRLRYLLRFFTINYVDRQNAPVADMASNFETTAEVTVNGKKIPYRQVGGMISNEKNQERRGILYRSQDEVLDSINVLNAKIEAGSQRLTKELGYSSYAGMIGDLKGYSLGGFQNVANHVLVQTDSLYRTLFGEMVRRYLKLDPGHVFVYDLRPLFRNVSFDRYFSGQAMLNTLSSTYEGLGIDIHSMNNLTIDTASRPAKNPRAACFAINVPVDVRLSVKPIGGFDDYAALFHEMGHALHYASTRENSFEFKYAGEETVTENYAFLSEYLTANQAWLRTRSIMPTPVLKDYVRFMAFYRLWYVRRYCAKFLYELQLHAGAGRPDSLYSSTLSSALGYVPTQSDAKHYLTDLDEGFYSAGYLRAWLLESQLNAKLSTTYGVNWFENPHAGEYLRSLWALGDRIEGEDLVRMLGDQEISPAAWLAEIKAMVLLSSKDTPAPKR